MQCRCMHTRKCAVWKAVFSSVSPLLTTSLQVRLSLLCLGSALERQRVILWLGLWAELCLIITYLLEERSFSRILVLCMNQPAQTSEPLATNKTKWMEHSASLTWVLSFTWTVNTQRLLIHTYPLQTHNHQYGNSIEIMLLSFFTVILLVQGMVLKPAPHQNPLENIVEGTDQAHSCTLSLGQRY